MLSSLLYILGGETTSVGEMTRGWGETTTEVTSWGQND